MNETPHSAESFHSPFQWRFHAAPIDKTRRWRAQQCSLHSDLSTEGDRDPLNLSEVILMQISRFLLPSFIAGLITMAQVSVWGFAVFLEKRDMMVHQIPFVEEAGGSVRYIPAFATRRQALRRFRVVPPTIKIKLFYILFFTVEM